MIKGILLDIDGTLVASNDAHAEAWQEAFTKFGYTIPFEQIRPLIGMGGDKLLPTLIPALTKNDGQGKEITEYRSKIFLKKYAHHLQPTIGARELVLELQKTGLKLIVASSASEGELGTLLKAAHVDDLLHEFTTSSDVEESKPAPDIIEVALKKVKLEPHEALMIGDTPYDIEAATKCGVAVIALRCGGFPEDLLVSARKTYDNPQDLQKHLEEELEEKNK